MSLIEIMVATVILSFVAIGTAEFFVRGRTGFDQEERKRVGVQLAQEALERTVALPYPQIDAWIEARTVGTVDYTIAVTSQMNVPEPDIKTVRCTVTWNATPTSERTTSLVTLVYDN
ncbi:MAG: type II secretion system protein [bacterium]|nr:type II secretion system protein [bacterium]MBK9304454.1 type II secretion system protein [bacterium]